MQLIALIMCVLGCTKTVILCNVICITTASKISCDQLDQLDYLDHFDFS